MSKGKEYLDGPSKDTDETKYQRIEGLLVYVRENIFLLRAALDRGDTHEVKVQCDEVEGWMKVIVEEIEDADDVEAE